MKLEWYYYNYLPTLTFLCICFKLKDILISQGHKGKLKFYNMRSIIKNDYQFYLFEFLLKYLCTFLKSLLWHHFSSGHETIGGMLWKHLRVFSSVTVSYFSKNVNSGMYTAFEKCRTFSFSNINILLRTKPLPVITMQ